MRFSEYFHLDKQQNELDFVDIPIDSDIALFVDPYALTKREDELSIEAGQIVSSFFQEVIEKIREGNDDFAQKMLSKLNESNDTHLGLSREKSQGKGVSGKQSVDLFSALKESRAVRTGFLHDLQDCELVIPGIGFDKISDVVVRLIKLILIGYTHRQCELLGIPTENVASGSFWNPLQREWDEKYVDLPVVEVDGKRECVVLIPKAFSRYDMTFNHAKYYNGFVLEFLQRQHIRNGSPLVHLLKNGNPKVYKKDLKSSPGYKLTKEFLYEFSNENPEVMDTYRQHLETKNIRPITNETIEDKQPREKSISVEPLVTQLQAIPTGWDSAPQYHSHMIGVLTAIFYPQLINPVKEREIHEGRKRVDISFSNAATTGFFANLGNQAISCPLIFFECKNYSREMGNPELDQMAGRFNPRRGRVGIITCRTIAEREVLVQRCKDTANDERGFIIVLDDADIIQLLRFREASDEAGISHFMRRKFEELVV